MKVFISSVTYLLKDERNALPDFLRVVDYEPIRFEDFEAPDRSSREACLAGVDAADVYVLLLGPRYGQPLPDTGRAPTAEEFTRARQRGIPVLVFSKKVDEPDEPAQAEFKNEVGHYVNGRLWRSFEDPMSCNLAVLEALKTLRLNSGPVERRAFSGDIDVPWLADIEATDAQGYPVLASSGIGGRGSGLLPGSVHSPVLELHLVPTETRVGSTSRQLSETARQMARTARQLAFVPEQHQIVVGSDDRFAWVVRPPELSSRAVLDGMNVEDFRGLVANGDGAVGAFEALPTDNMGALTDAPALQSVLARLYGLAASHLPETEWVSVAVGLDNADRVFEGDPRRMGSRNQGFMRSPGQVIRAGNDFAVPTGRLAQAFGDINADLVHALLARLARLR